MSEPKDYWTCEKCGDKFFPNTNKKNWIGITVIEGTCPDCGEENVTLIPVSDFKGIFD